MFKWNFEKNEILFDTRGITFDEVVQAVADGQILSDEAHPNHKKYPNQRVMVVSISGYTYLVPYVMDGEDYFLKTIIPSRKAMKRFIGE
jgi:uncharacterized DUF497 family protein